MAKQFVVQLKNQPGALAVLAEELASRGVDLRAIGGGSIGDSGHVIMTTADDDTTKAVLDEGGYTYVEGEAILSEVGDRPGGMAAVARELADAGVNIQGHLFWAAGATGRCSPSSSTSPTWPGRSSSASRKVDCLGGSIASAAARQLVGRRSAPVEAPAATGGHGPIARVVANGRPIGLVSLVIAHLPDPVPDSRPLGSVDAPLECITRHCADRHLHPPCPAAPVLGTWRRWVLFDRYRSQLNRPPSALDEQAAPIV